MNEEIISSIESYIRKEKTDYALMITGPWGCGKSYHWRNTIRPKIESLKVGSGAEKEDEYYHVIDVSLNGIESKDDIISQILSSHFAKEDAGIIAWDIVRELAGTFKMAEIFGKVSKQLVKGNIGSLISSSNTILCFDDLERISMPLQSILGYINTTFIERHHYKVVFISDEGKMMKRNQLRVEQKKEYSDYFSIKEKFIGRTLRFRLDVKTIIEDISNQIAGSDQGFISFIASNISLITSIIDDGMNIETEPNGEASVSSTLKIENIRTIRFAMEMLHEIYSRDPSKGLFDVYGRESLVFIFMIAIEFKRGNLNADDYSDNMGIPKMGEAAMFHGMMKVSKSRSSILAPKEEEEEKEPEYVITLHNRYYGLYSINTLFVQGLYEYILTGYYNDDEIALQVDTLIRKQDEPHFQAYKALTHSVTLEDEEFLNQMNILRQSVMDNKWDLYSYTDLYSLIVYYIGTAILDMNKQELLKMLITAARNSISISKYDPMWNHTRKVRLGDRSGKDKSFDDLLRVISDCDSLLNRREQKQVVRTFLDDLDSDSENMNEGAENLSQIPIFLHIDENDFSRILKEHTNANVQKFNRIVHFGLEYNLKTAYAGDSTAVKKYIKLLENEIKSETEKPIRRLELSHLKDTLEELRTKIDEK